MMMATLGSTTPDQSMLARLGQGLGNNQMALLGLAGGLLGGQGFAGGFDRMASGSKIDQSRQYLARELADKKKKEDEAAARKAALIKALGPDLVERLGADDASDLIKMDEIGKRKPRSPIEVSEGASLLDPTTYQPLYSGRPKVTEKQRDLMAAGVDPQSEEGRKRLLGEPPVSPYERKAQENKAETEKERQTNAEGAQGFVQKVDRLEALIKEGGEDAFGPAQGGSYNRAAGAFFGTKTEQTRQQIDAVLRDLELDVAKMKLKGQGTVTETERRIAKETLPTLQTMDTKTALNILAGLRQEATGILQRGGGGGQPNQSQAKPDPLGIR
jgi:hypothetical protein